METELDVGERMILSYLVLIAQHSLETFFVTGTPTHIWCVFGMRSS